MARTLEEKRKANREAQRRFYRRHKKELLIKYRQYRHEYYQYYWNLHKGEKDEATKSDGSTIATSTKKTDN